MRFSVAQLLPQSFSLSLLIRRAGNFPALRVQTHRPKQLIHFGGYFQASPDFDGATPVRVASNLYNLQSTPDYNLLSMRSPSLSYYSARSTMRERPPLLKGRLVARRGSRR